VEELQLNSLNCELSTFCQQEFADISPNYLFLCIKQKVTVMKRVITLLLGAFCLLSISVLLNACSSDEDESLMTRTDGEKMAYDDCINIPHPEDTWVFPAYPGTTEWIELHQRHIDDGIMGIINELMPSDDVVKKMSTEGIIRSYIDYPYANENEALAYETYLSMVVSFAESPFGQEMIRRSDSALILTNIYRDFNPLCEDEDAQAWNVHSILLRMMDVEEIHNQLSIEGKKEYIRTALDKLALENSDSAVAIHVAFTCGRIMKSAGYTPLLEAINTNDAMRLFLDYWTVSSQGDRGIETIISLAKDFINS
jgi:hypothetical protein